jgi:molecular chaperone DnaK
MVKDAEAHAEEDLRVKEQAEVRNSADSLIYATEKTLKDLGDKVPDETKGACEDAMGELKKALEGDDIDAVKSGIETLQEASYKLAEIVYQDAQGAESGDGAEPAEAADAADAAEDVVDADYEVVEDEDK